MTTVLGAKSTAMEALRGADMTGKAVVVTGERPLASRPSCTVSLLQLHQGVCSGGNSGLGVETARTLAYAGAKVIITSRSLAAGQTVADELNTAGLKICKAPAVKSWLNMSDSARPVQLCKPCLSTLSRVSGQSRSAAA